MSGLKQKLAQQASPTDTSSQAVAGMVAAPVDAQDEGATSEEAEVKRPAGIYSDHCNCIYVGSGQRYKWPRGAAFDLEQVDKRHIKKVKEQLASMLDRGYAEEVE